MLTAGRAILNELQQAYMIVKQKRRILHLLDYNKQLIYPSWHAPSGSGQFCLFGWCVILVGHFPQKSHGRNLKIGLPFFPPPNHALLPLTHNLTVPCIGWVQVGEVWALCVPSFHVGPKLCLLLSHLPWSRGLPA